MMLKLIIRRVRSFLVGDNGRATAEYAVILAAIVIVAIGSIWRVASLSDKEFRATKSALEARDERLPRPKGGEARPSVVVGLEGSAPSGEK